jgi:hypothetical protein
VKKQNLFLSIICLLLAGVAGCRHKPVNAVVVMLTDEEPDDGVAAYAEEEGGTLTFKTKSTTYPNFKIHFDDKPSPCKVDGDLTSKDGTVTCQIREGATRTKAYKYTVTQTGPVSPPVTASQSGAPPTPPPPPPGAKVGYIRPCKNCT